MATRFTKSAKDAFILAVLKDSFSSRIEKLREDCRKLIVEAIRIQHPVWVEMWAKKPQRDYIKFASDVYVRFDGGCACAPNFDYGNYDRNNTIRIDVERPHRYECDIKGTPVGDEYLKFSEEYEQACKTLASAVNAYSSVEKFTADFPQFDKYFSKRLEGTTCTALAVIPQQVTEKLAAVGVPAK